VDVLWIAAVDLKNGHIMHCVCAGGTIVSKVVTRKRNFISSVAIWGSLKISTD